MPFRACNYLTAITLFTMASFFCLGSAHAVLINEIRVDQPGADSDEYFELIGNAGESLDLLSYIVIGDGSGGSGVIESVTHLSGLHLGQNGLFLATEDSFSLGAAADLITSLNFENRDNVTHLLVSTFNGSKGDDLDLDDDGLLDTAPWLEVVDSLAFIDSIGSGDRVYSPHRLGPKDNRAPGHAFRAPGGGPWQAGTMTMGDDTPGQTNVTVPEPPTLGLFVLGLLGVCLLPVRRRASHGPCLEAQSVTI
jgi:hypothetical protein